MKDSLYYSSYSLATVEYWCHFEQGRVSNVGVLRSLSVRNLLLIIRLVYVLTTTRLFSWL